MDVGTGRIAWTVATRGTASHLTHVGMGDGFLVASFDCVGFVEASGRLRWTMAGGLSAATRVGDTVVIASPRGGTNVVGLEASTGRRLWGTSRGGFADAIVADEDAILVAGSGAKAVTAHSVVDGSPIGDGLHAHGFFSSAVAARNLLVTAGVGGGHEGAVVATDPSGHVVLDARVAMVSPAVVAVTDKTIAVQSDGVLVTRPFSSRKEPPTHLAGVDRADGKTRWSRELEGQSANRGVAIGRTIVIQLAGALTGIDADSGGTRWSRPRVMILAGFSVEADDRAVALGNPDGLVEVTEADTGDVRWATRLDGPVERLGRLTDDVLLAASATGSITAFRVADGTPLWSERGPTMTTASAGPHALRSVITAAGTAVMPSGLSSLIALRTAP